MDNNNIEINIADIQYFQKYEMHEEALTIALQIPTDKLESLNKCKLYKLTSLSYRKLGLTEDALIYINRAISVVKNENNWDNKEKEIAICLMNKGVIYDAAKSYKEACDIYRQALSIFKSIEGIEDGIVANALINYAEALLKINKRKKAVFIFRDILQLINDENDMRYQYVINKLGELENK